MQSPGNPRSGWLIGIAALSLIGLMILPPTGWLARLQMRTLIWRSAEIPSLLKDLGVKEAPGIDLDRATPILPTSEKSDYATELGRAVATGYEPTTTQNTHFDNQMERQKRLRALADRFPEHRKQALAHSLRYFTLGLVHIRRDSEVEPYMTGKPFTSTSVPDPRQAEALAAFDRDAHDGELADPDNAYFPLMRAMGLFEAHRDAEGLAEMKLAASKSIFDEYSFDEPEASLTRLERTYGHPTTLVRQSIYVATLFPHFAQLRGMARLTAYLATKAEVSGHVDDGIDIRTNMMRCAALMRAESHSAIGTLVGVAMFHIMIARPGGSPPRGGMSNAEWEALPEKARTDTRLALFTRYLDAHHRESIATWVRQESAAGFAAQDIIKRNTDRGTFMGASTARLLNRWAISIVALTNLMTFLALCGALLSLRMLKNESGARPFMIAVFICGFATVVAIRSEWLPAMAALQNVITNLSSSDTATTDVSIQTAMALLLGSPIVGRLIVVSLSVMLPWLLTLWLAVARERPAEDGRSSRITGPLRVGGVLCLIFAIFYGVALVATVREEDRQANAIAQATRHEGRYMAQQLKATWPPLNRQ